LGDSGSKVLAEQGRDGFITGVKMLVKAYAYGGGTEINCVPDSGGNVPKISVHKSNCENKWYLMLDKGTGAFSEVIEGVAILSNYVVDVRWSVEAEFYVIDSV
jgi:hypothetical protein